ncbi:MAG: hypothetical protein ACMXX8_04055, partial [Candidatus Woesearchaeota archaeon]
MEKKLKSCMKKHCIKFKKSLYFKSLKSINMKHIYSSLTDASFLFLISLLSFPIALILDLIIDPEDFNTISEIALIKASENFLLQ